MTENERIAQAPAGELAVSTEMQEIMLVGEATRALREALGTDRVFIRVGKTARVGVFSESYIAAIREEAASHD